MHYIPSPLKSYDNFMWETGANLVLVQLMRKVAKTDSWESELFNESVDPVHKIQSEWFIQAIIWFEKT